VTTHQATGGNGPRRRRRRGGGGVIGNPVPALLVGVGLAWLALSERRRGAPARAGAGGVDAPAAADRPDAHARGLHAESPTEVPARGWKEVLLRVKDEVTKDNMSIVAAGCAFYALLALFPAITAMVSTYGLVADPADVERHMQALAGVVPGDAFAIIRDQTHAVAAGGETALGWGAALALVLALYSASSGVQTLFTALNIAYEEDETRGFLAFYLTSFAFTLAAVLGIALALGVLVGVPAALAFLPVSPVTEWVVRLASFAILLVIVVGGISAIYRFGPSRAPADWRWLTPGAIAATVLWLLASFGFSWYAANFAGYNETYGALGGVIALLMWLWISAYVVLLGAELNSELELQTAHDTTTGPPLPEGSRGAFAADHNPDSRAAAEAARG
jgi:membrane protein